MLLAQYVSLGRETTDLDFLLRGLSADKEKIESIIDEICLAETHDSFEFTQDKTSIVDHLLTKYPGYELSLSAKMGNTITKISVDIGVGSWAEAVSKEIDLIATSKGAIFDSDISLMVYPVEMIFAEKLQTACFRGANNSRMKDYHDMFVMCATKDRLDVSKLEKYIVQVFADRETALSAIPSFEGDELSNLQRMWERHRQALALKVREDLPPSIFELISIVNNWLSKNLTSL
jgi:predicted nucleotidyltransferase component of viral defense system